MHRSETYDLVRCVQCGAEVSISANRAFVIGQDNALCFACSIDHGGQYDEEHDDWVQPPNLLGLADLLRDNG